MTSPVPRKSTRGKKIPLDLTNPKSELAKYTDIKALVKKKVGQLSKDAQKELMTLLPPCDQQYSDLKTALNVNPIFWSSLGEWHDLLQGGELKPSKKNLSARDLEAIPWKDDNYERFWGEKIKSANQPKEEDIQPKEEDIQPMDEDKQQPQQQSPPQPKRQPRAATKKKAKAKDGPKVERRGRKKKVVVPPPPEQVDTLMVAPPLDNSINHDDAKQTTDTKPTDDATQTNTAHSADEAKPADVVKPTDTDEKQTGDDDAKPMGTEPTATACPESTADSTPSVADAKPAESRPTPTPVTSTSAPTTVPGITIPIHAPASIVNRNKNNHSTTTRAMMETRDTIRLLPKPKPSPEDELLIYGADGDFQDQSTAKLPKVAKRPRKTTKKSARNTHDDRQYTDGDNSDIPAPKRATRSRTVSN